MCPQRNTQVPSSATCCFWLAAAKAACSPCCAFESPLKGASHGLVEKVSGV